MTSVSDTATFRGMLENFSITPQTLLNGPSPISRLNHHLRTGDNMVLVVWRAMRDLLGVPTLASLSSNTKAFDAFVTLSYPPPQVATYELACMRILLADRLAMGYTTILRFYAREVWLVVLLLAASHISRLINGTRDVDVGTLLGLGLKLAMLSYLGRVSKG